MEFLFESNQAIMTPSSNPRIQVLEAKGSEIQGLIMTTQDSASEKKLNNKTGWQLLYSGDPTPVLYEFF